MQPPSGNPYWEGRLCYIESSVRYLSIPILFDLFLKARLTTSKKLFDTLSVLETELEISEYEERGETDFLSALHATMNLAAVDREYGRRKVLRDRMLRYVTTTPAHLSLRRGNFILPYFSLLNVNDSAVMRMCKLATSVVNCGCILDDLMDYRSDKDKGEPNIIAELEASFSTHAICEVTKIYRDSVAVISRYNRQIETFLLSSFCNLSFRWRLSA
jgi:hypothetical protein